MTYHRRLHSGQRIQITGKHVIICSQKGDTASRPRHLGAGNEACRSANKDLQSCLDGRLPSATVGYLGCSELRLIRYCSPSTVDYNHTSVMSVVNRECRKRWATVSIGRFDESIATQASRRMTVAVWAGKTRVGTTP